MQGAESALRVGQWTGSLAELVAAMESGAVAPAEVPLQEIIASVRADVADLEAASTAYALLARAIDLKARSLLPTPPPDPEPEPEAADEEAEAARLAERVAAYQAFAEAAAALREFEHRRQVRFGRPEAAAAGAKAAAGRVPRAAEPPDPAEAAQALEKLLTVFAEVWERSRPRTREVVRERYTVAQAVSRLRQRLAAARSLEFAHLFSDDADRLEVVVTFLALLELVRVGEVTVRQDQPFSPVGIAWVGARPAARTEAGAAT